MKNQTLVIWTLGMACGMFLTMLAMALQPRQINVSFPSGIEAKLNIDAIDNCIVKGSC